MSDTRQFLDEMMPRIHEAERALHDDAGPRFGMWSHTDPVACVGRWLRTAAVHAPQHDDLSARER